MQLIGSSLNYCFNQSIVSQQIKYRKSTAK
jgi:hypothetical protein